MRCQFLYALFAIAILCASGCTAPSYCSSCGDTIAAELSARTAVDYPCSVARGFVLPADVVLEDGVTEDEALATALTNNSAFQAMLTQLGMAEGDLVQAGLLTNPSLVNFIPVGVKQWEWTVFAPIEAFLLRPERVVAAESQYESVAAQLVQNGLNLVRDVRVAHANLAVAVSQHELALEAVQLRESIAQLTEKQLSRGNISELEAMTARIDVLNAKANAALLEQDIVVASTRLALLLGLPPGDVQLTASLHDQPTRVDLDVEGLVQQALASRPDAQAAEWAVTAAAQRVEVARWQFVRIDLAADANQKGEKGFEIGPAIRFDLPIFNRNEGGVMRADAELAQAEHNRDAIYEQINQEVRAAAAQTKQASAQLAILEQQVAPALQEALSIAERGYDGGATDYLLVLLSSTQFLDAKARILDQQAALLRARAELERGIGGRMDATLPMPELIKPPALLEDSAIE